MKRLLLILLLLGIAGDARADLDFFVYDNPETGNPLRYEQSDLIDIQPARGPLVDGGPFRRARIITTRTKADVMSYLVPKENANPDNARLRLYYLDTTRMSAADLATWNANRCIEQTEAIALGWIRSK